MVFHVALSKQGWMLVDGPPDSTTTPTTATATTATSNSGNNGSSNRSSHCGSSNNNGRHTTTCHDLDSLHHATTCRWMFASILPSLLIGISTGIVYESVRRSLRQQLQEKDATTTTTTNLKKTKKKKEKATSMTTTAATALTTADSSDSNSNIFASLWNFFFWLPPLPPVDYDDEQTLDFLLEHHRRHHAEKVSFLSRWGWLLLLPCKSPLSWTLGPLAAMWYLSLQSTKNENEDTSNKEEEEGTRQPQQQQLWNMATSTTATVASSQASVTEWDNHHHTNASAAAAAAATAPNKAPPPKRYLEILVHNVAHTDMILSLQAPPLLASSSDASYSYYMVDHPLDKMEEYDIDNHGGALGSKREAANKDEFCLCRPRFSAFAEFSSIVAKALPEHLSKDMIIPIDRYERMEDADTGGYHIVTPRKNNNKDSKNNDDGDDDDEQGTNNLHATTTPTTSNTASAMDAAAVDTPTTKTTPTLPLPTGFRLDTSHPNVMIPQEQWSDLRVRGRDAPRVEHCPLAGLPLNAVFFPLLAILLPKWHQQMTQKYQSTTTSMTSQPPPPQDPTSSSTTTTTSTPSFVLPNVKQVLILVTGVGTPRNSTHDVKGNSTLELGILMERFVKLLYPNITVVRVHSETNLFRYDENIAFVEQELMPCIHAYRDAHARGLPYPDEEQEKVKATDPSGTTTNVVVLPTATKKLSLPPPFDPEWYKSFSLTLSFADGSHARTHAIQASLRVSYRPTYFHVWQLKTFWHVGKLVDDDIEVYSFEEMETSPALEPSATLCPNTNLVWEEMKAFKQEFVECMKKNERNDMANFWLRKTRQPVLAVLLVQSEVEEDNGVVSKPRLYRGTNMEVSMPTGSLCAERNVIGSALADNPSLKREDLKIIAVLQVPLEEIEVGQQHAAPAAASANHGLMMKHSSSFISCSSATHGGGIVDVDDDWILPTDEQSSGNRGGSGGTELPPPQVVAFAGGGPVLPSTTTTTTTEPPSTPVRRIPLYPHGQQHRNSATTTTTIMNMTTTVKTKGGGGSSTADLMARRPKRTVVVDSPVDKNPLKPCGACNEWLKKIAECNPYFKIITFTDKECNGIYIRPVQE